MPRRTDISSILVIGAGPIIIGQACEFDYSGVQAIKALKEEGYRVILVNSNPATIMTDAGLADATYIEPITTDFVEKIIAREKPDALLPTMGGQTALNCALALQRAGTLEKHGVELIGARAEAIEKAEDRELFRQAMDRIGLENPRAAIVEAPPITDEAGNIVGRDRMAGLSRAMDILGEVGLPAIIRPAFTLGGTGGGVAYNIEEYREIVESGLAASPVGQVLVDESLLGWKEYEMEVVRDKNDNAIIICSIENIDPMGVHTGDSITVAPALTLTDKEYQIMRTAAIAVLREIGVETGGSNVQFAVEPDTGRLVVIEMNPRVSRSSALASKATGFPIAKVAAKLAVGYTLDELENDITGGVIPASFEPTLDYVVTKIPRFAFEKFKGAEPLLTTAMKSVGEAMAIGRSFKESLQKALCSLETGLTGFDEIDLPDADAVRRALSVQTPDRLRLVAEAFRRGLHEDEIHRITSIDPWFLREIREIVEAEMEVAANGLPESMAAMTALKAMGFSDARLAALTCASEAGVRAHRHALGVRPVYKRIDTCAAEFVAATPYLYSTYEMAPFRTGEVLAPPSLARESTAAGTVFSSPASAGEVGRPKAGSEGAHEPQTLSRAPSVTPPDGGAPPPPPKAGEENSSPAAAFPHPGDEAGVSDRRKAIILGGGPNRIGQGIEFDYCCCHAAFAMADLGIESIMVNCNPETVSTDYDTSDRLYFEPLTSEHVLEIIAREQTAGELAGIIVQFGGQTPLKLAGTLQAHDIPILGTSPASIDLAEDREQFAALIDRLGLQQAPSITARTVAAALKGAETLGYPVMVRPSYVLGGQAMEIARTADDLETFAGAALKVSGDQSLFIDRYLEDAVEVDIDALCDGEAVHIAGIMEHIEEAGVHSGDSACALPPYTLPPSLQGRLSEQAVALARALKVQGLINIQFAVKGEEIFVLEANPRASRTVPFVAKAVGAPIAGIAAKLMAGSELTAFDLTHAAPRRVAVKEAVFPFGRFANVDPVLGPEMRSTGEVMGWDDDFGAAFAKSQIAASQTLPREGRVFVSVKDADKPGLVEPVRELIAMGFAIVATRGTASFLAEQGLEVAPINKVLEGQPHVIDAMINGEIQLVFNTTQGAQSLADSKSIRRTALTRAIPYFTTLAASRASVQAIAALRSRELDVRALQSP